MEAVESANKANYPGFRQASHQGGSNSTHGGFAANVGIQAHVTHIANITPPEPEMANV